MKKLYFLIIALSALMFASSCQKDEGGLKPQMRKVTVRAKFAHTKVALSGAQVQWEKGDEIALVFPHETEASHVCYLTTEIVDLATSAKFKGSLDKRVTTGNGYDEDGFVVYPKTAVDANGSFVFALPAEQTAVATVDKFAGFHKDANLTSGTVSLKKIVSVGSAESQFRNACAVLRFTLAKEVASMTLTGTSNLAGQAPLVLDENGRLVIDTDAEWSEDAKSVTLKPSNGDTFEDGTAYNLLVWPGEHTALTLTVNYKGYGPVSKTTTLKAKFEANKYYTLNFNASSEALLVELDGALDNMIDGLTEFEGRLEAAESDVNLLVSQIQSVSLMTEYLDNAVYAPYGIFSIGGLQKQSVNLNYLIKPAYAAEALVEAFKQDKTIVTGLLGYSKSTGFEVTGTNLPVDNLIVAEVDGADGIVTATVNMSYVSNDFYQGKYGAAVALQIKSDEAKVDIHSEFASLVPRNGTMFSCSYITDVPAISGARVSIPFTYTLADPSVSPTVTANGVNVENAYASLNTASMSGNLIVVFSESHPLEDQKVTLELTVGAEVITQEFTFVDSGADFDIVNPGEIDYVGGDFIIEVVSEGTKTWDLTSSGTGVANIATLFSFDENTGDTRTMTIGCNATIPSTSLTYYKSITVTQKAFNTSLNRKYYSNGDKILLNNASASSCSHYFNIVILGDGYTKKDLNEGGKFEQRARSAMDSFFALEPYKTFKDRFNVYMVAYESTDEGTDIKSSGIEKNTYFGSYCQGGGNTAAYVADTNPVINAVKAAVGSSDDAYYRSIAILLINTDEQAGSTGYPFRDSKSGWVNGYASFSIAVLAANTTGTNGLVKHEAGGHAFGRLADEYYTPGNTASDANKTDLSNWHAKGWYWNVSPTNTGNYYKFTNSAYTADEVQYWEGGWGYNYGIYRPTTGGMMQGSTGVFNAPCRHAIYHRIITETEGVGAYSWSKFLDYDKINR